MPWRLRLILVYKKLQCLLGRKKLRVLLSHPKAKTGLPRKTGGNLEGEQANGILENGTGDFHESPWTSFHYRKKTVLRQFCIVYVPTKMAPLRGGEGLQCQACRRKTRLFNPDVLLLSVVLFLWPPGLTRCQALVSPVKDVQEGLLREVRDAGRGMSLTEFVKSAWGVKRTEGQSVGKREQRKRDRTIERENKTRGTDSRQPVATRERTEEQETTTRKNNRARKPESTYQYDADRGRTRCWYWECSVLRTYWTS